MQTIALESAVYADMSRWISAYDFCSSPEWARTLDEHKIGVLVRESSCYTGCIDTFDYDCVLAESDDHSDSCKNSPDTGAIASPGVKYTLVLGNEYGSKRAFSNEPRRFQEAHMTIRDAMQSRQTLEAGERANRTNGRFENAVYTLLWGLRLLNAT